MVNCRSLCVSFVGLLVGILFEYDTPKFVHIKSKKVGVLNRLVQLGIVGYIIGYGIVWQHGAQNTETVQSVVTTKVKGVDILYGEQDFMVNCPESPYDWSIYDHIDLVVPPQEPNSFFVTTNMWVTCNQTYGICQEDPGVPGSNCNDSNPCPKDVILRTGNGVTTGNCSENNICLIRGWCPTEAENDTITKQRPKVDTQNFTVLIKNSISFPRLDKNYRVRNIPDTTNHTFLKHCTFDPSTEDGLFCPIFSLQQIVDMMDSSDTYETLATEGAVVGLIINWDCNLDVSYEHCKPEYSARRLDNPVAQISPGYNFRYPKYYYVNGVERRDVWKVYGIKFVIQVTGQGRKFSFTTLVLALGSMIALLAIATTVTDVFALYLLKKAPLYRKKKYQQVEASKERISNGSSHIYDSEYIPILQDNKSYTK